MDTIFAEATPPGRGGVSIVRLSGPDARGIAEALAGPLNQPRLCVLRNLRDGSDEIDRALVIRFEGGASFTGEESVEFHTHGAPVVVKRLQTALAARGARRAEAGEFTLRAFMSGQMDLAEVEGLSDLLDAETEEQRKLAVKVSGGALSELVTEWREQLISAGALLTAAIDFADEEIPDDVAAGVSSSLERLRQSITDQVDDFPATERLRVGFEVALVGKPNAGKSSLMNAIAKRDIAIVSKIAGTTRDIVEFRADLNGLAVTFLDTAGIRQTEDEVEAIGIGNALARAAVADIRLFIGPVPEDAVHLKQHGDIFVETRADLTGNECGVSSVTGAGITGLLDQIDKTLRVKYPRSGIVGHARQAEALADAAKALTVNQESEPELVTEGIRLCARRLERVVGKIDAEDYLDRVFSSFCIGK